MNKPPAALSRITPRSASFRRGREAGWQALERILDIAEKRGIGKLSAEELRQLPLLYRAALSSLSVARAIALDRNLLLYLEALATRGYFVVYSPKAGIWRSFAGFLRHGFPRAVRAVRWHGLIALLCLLAATAAGAWLQATDATWFSAFVPAGLAGDRGPDSTAADLHDNEIFAPWPGFAQSFLLFANVLFEHNTTVGLLMFGLSFLAGVPTLLLLIYQGLIMGVFIGLHLRRGLLVDFLGWIAIHGVTEFGAILLCSAGGLLIAEKILFPERLSRRDSLARHGRLAGQVAGGAALMFLVAGLIEGGFRQLIASTPGRFAFAGMTALFWLGYFCSGRGRQEDDA